MSTVRDLCAVVVYLVANAKSVNQDTGGSMRCSDILNSLDAFERGTWKISKFPLVYMGVFLTIRVFRCDVDYI